MLMSPFTAVREALVTPPKAVKMPGTSAAKMPKQPKAKVKGYADGGMVHAPNTPSGTCGPGVRSQQDYKK